MFDGYVTFSDQIKTAMDSKKVPDDKNFKVN